VSAAVDRIADPRQACLKEVIEKGFEPDFHSSLIPEEYGGLGASTLDYAVLLEELAVGDIGMANAFHVVMSHTETPALPGSMA
jgi:alkylation response protein AidB-like acyl-CoA dehydrogenase